MTIKSADPQVTKALETLVKKTTKPRTRKAPAKKAPVRVNRGGGRALGDFTNDQRLTVVRGKRQEMTRADCFRSGMTVGQCLTKQKDAGYRGRRKYIRTQIAAGRVTLKA